MAESDGWGDQLGQQLLGPCGLYRSLHLVYTLYSFMPIVWVF
jgi:hypothetical protein